MLGIRQSCRLTEARTQAAEVAIFDLSYSVYGHIVYCTVQYSSYMDRGRRVATSQHKAVKSMYSFQHGTMLQAILICPAGLCQCKPMGKCPVHARNQEIAN